VTSIFDRLAFQVGSATFGWDDVILASMMWGDWRAFEEQVHQRLALIAHAEADADAPGADLEAAAAEFRYARDLVSAEDMEAWLERRGLTVEAWLAYIRRAALDAAYAGNLTQVVAHYPVDHREIQEVALAEALCSGELARMAEKLAARAAVYEWLTEMGSAPEIETEVRPEATQTALRCCDSLGELGVPAVSPEGVLEKVEKLARLEAAFERFRHLCLTPKAIQDQIALHQLDWVRVDCRALAFPREDAAREAAFCVREDGLEIADVAAQAAADLRQERFYLSEVDSEMQARFLAARRGELIGPLAMDGEFVLFFLADKTMPTADDPETRLLAEKSVLERALAREMSHRVRWIDQL
jgi:hypothetical protein